MTLLIVDLQVALTMENGNIMDEQDLSILLDEQEEMEIEQEAVEKLNARVFGSGIGAIISSFPTSV